MSNEDEATKGAHTDGGPEPTANAQRGAQRWAAAAGIGSAALVAALLYSRRRDGRKDSAPATHGDPHASAAAARAERVRREQEDDGA